jgi:hypothetical protein
MSQETLLDVLDAEWLSQQRIISQIKHPENQIATTSPIRVDIVEFFRVQWRTFGGGSCRTECADLLYAGSGSDHNFVSVWDKGCQ